MADLLECLLQIKGLDATIHRVHAMSARVPPEKWTSEAIAGIVTLAHMEIVWGAAIRLILTEAQPVLPATNPVAVASLGRRVHLTARQAIDRFTAHRGENVELLDTCSAQDLSRVALHPSRRAMTLADLIALMLAADVECVGEIRRRLSE